MFARLKDDIDAIMSRDPAARSRLEVLICYPGLHAVLFHRVAGALWRRGLKLPGRIVSQLARFLTGIEIHPGARIGRRLVIDHGMGLVIGETGEIGDDVTLYHGVTLGGLRPSIDAAGQANRKRHPTLQDRAIVSSGAQVLGPITIGIGARVGANAVVTDDVAPGTTVVGIPARVARRPRPVEIEAEGAFCAYGLPDGQIADPVLRTIETLSDEVRALTARLDELERARDEREVAAEARTGTRY